MRDTSDWRANNYSNWLTNWDWVKLYRYGNGGRTVRWKEGCINLTYFYVQKRPEIVARFQYWWRQRTRNESFKVDIDWLCGQGPDWQGSLWLCLPKFGSPPCPSKLRNSVWLMDAARVGLTPPFSLLLLPPPSSITWPRWSCPMVRGSSSGTTTAWVLLRAIRDVTQLTCHYWTLRWKIAKTLKGENKLQKSNIE